MPTPRNRRQHNPAPDHSPDTAQRPGAALTIRRIAALPPLPPTRYACDRCETGWSGPELDCWNCGRPATALSRKAASALQLLHDAVTPPTPARKERTA
jgi:hypothetical protein